MSMGWDTLVGIDTANPITKAYEFTSFGLRGQGSHHDPNGARGIRGHQSERVREAAFDVAGPGELEPSPETLADLFPWIMGANASGTSFALADTLQSRYVTVDRVAKVHTYADVYIDSATFRGAEKQPISLALAMVGKTETEGNAGTFPSVSPGLTPPFMFKEAVFTILGAARKVKDFSLTINNALDVQFFNSLTATRITPSDRVVTLDLTVPYDTDNVDLAEQAVAGDDGTLVIAFDNYSLTFTFGNLQFPKTKPVINGKGEQMLPLSGMARRLSTTPELAVTLDSTP
jgi:hypothetical protein